MVLSGCVQTPRVPHDLIPSKDPNASRPIMPGGDSNSSSTYIVKPNDTLYKIAKQNGVQYQDLAAWNGISPPYNIFAGQTLVLHNLQQSKQKILGIPTIPRLNPQLPQDGCEVSVVRIKPFYHSNTFSSFCGLLSACVGTSYIVKNNSAQARVVDVVYASEKEERVLHRALKIEGQALFTGEVYDVDQSRKSWNIFIRHCFW